MAEHLSRASKEKKKEKARKHFCSEKVFLLLLLPTLRADAGCLFPGWGCREVGVTAAGNRLCGTWLSTAG